MKQQKKLIGALDIGTSKVIALIGELQEDNEIHIIGLGQAPANGLKAGMVTNIDATVQSIKQAVEEAQLMGDCTIDSVTTGIAGNHIRSQNSQGVVKIKDSEVSQADIDRAVETAKAISIQPENQILHTVIQEHIIDNHPGVQDPIGMSGIRLDTRIHIATGSITAVQNIKKCITRCGLKIDNMILQPIASSNAVLTEDEKEFGICVVDIGGGTTDIAVYIDGAIRHTAVIPLAGVSITKDLTQALRTPYDAAEDIKIRYGLAREEGREGVMVEIPSVGGRNPRQTERDTLARVISPRVTEILEVTRNELNKAGFPPEEVLTSGIVLTGGTALLPGIDAVAEDIFNVPVRIGIPREMGGLSERIRNPRFSTAIGLLHEAARHTAQTDQPRTPNSDNKAEEEPQPFLTWFKNFLKNNF